VQRTKGNWLCKEQNYCQVSQPFIECTTSSGKVKKLELVKLSCPLMHKILDIPTWGWASSWLQPSLRLKKWWPYCFD
jgi:hypothetical protein